MIQYKNINGNSVTEEQFKMLTEYEIHTYDDSTEELKKIETVRLKREGVTYKWFQYYMDPTENKNAIIQQFTDEVNDFRLGIYLNKQNSFGFIMWDYEGYTSAGILKTKGKIVFDDSERLIFSCSFDLQTNELKSFPYPTKYYYGNSSELEGLVLRFTYELDENNNYQVRIKDVYETTGEIHTMA